MYANCELLQLSPQEERLSKERRGRQGEENKIENAEQELEPKKRPSCSSCSAFSILFSLPADLCALCSGVSSAVGLAQARPNNPPHALLNIHNSSRATLVNGVSPFRLIPFCLIPFRLKFRKLILKDNNCT